VSSLVFCERVFLLVEILVDEPEERSSDESNDGRAGEYPGQVWIFDETREGKTKCIGNGAGEQVHSGNQATHVLWCHGISNAESGDVDEKLGDSTDTDWKGSPPNGDVGDESIAIRVNAAKTGSMLSARTDFVSIVVENGISNTGRCRHEQTKSDTSDGAKVDVLLSEKWVESVVEKWCSDDDCERVDVIDDIVGNSVGLQHGGKS